MNGDDQFKLGERLASMEASINSLSASFGEFKQGVGSRVEKLEEKTSGIKELANIVNELKSSKSWVVNIILGAVIAAVISLVIRR